VEGVIRGPLEGSAKGLLEGSAKGLLEGSAKGPMEGRLRRRRPCSTSRFIRLNQAYTYRQTTVVRSRNLVG